MRSKSHSVADTPRFRLSTATPAWKAELAKHPIAKLDPKPLGSEIIAASAYVAGISARRVMSTSRSLTSCHARFIAWRAMLALGYSLMEAAHALDRDHHSTVLSGMATYVRKAEQGKVSMEDDAVALVAALCVGRSLNRSVCDPDALLVLQWVSRNSGIPGQIESAALRALTRYGSD